MDRLAEVARLLGAPNTGLVRRQAVIAGTNNDGTYTVLISGFSTATSGVHALASGIEPGDTVWLLADKSDLLIIGRQAPSDKTYSPTWLGATTNPTNVGVVGRYRRVPGGLIWVSLVFTANASFTGGSGSYTTQLPFAARERQAIPGILRQAASTPIWLEVAAGSTTGTFRYANPAATANQLATITGTVPVTLAVGDVLTFEGAYEPAVS
jgi:hypothetical protein